MKIKVCDALCGSGKTSACIRMMNERTEARFIFVTQFLSEVDRIKAQCAERGFVSPDCDLEHRKTKLSDIRRLLQEGNNIATTHALFVSCTDDIKELIRDKNYILVLDETVDVMRMSGLKPCDINLLEYSNIIAEDEDGRVDWIYDTYEKEDYDGEGKFSKEVLLAKSKNLLKYDKEYFFWSVPPELFSCFSEVYVLTYLFHAQILRCFFDMYKLPYEYIGVKNEDGYRFCDAAEMNRAHDLRGKIHVLEHPKLNAVGDKRGDLSLSSYTLHNHREGMGLTNRIRKNLVNVFRNIFNAGVDEIMWTVFKDFKDEVADKKFRAGFVTYNKRASNECANRRYLAYCINNFMRPWEARYYRERGVRVDQDSYALSILVQWVFRSAIRNGEEIWLYLPSARMRSLFYQWLDNLAEGRDLEPVVYRTSRPRFGRRKGAHNGAGEERKDV